MYVDSRLLRLERLYSNDANSKYTAKVLNYSLGSTATEFDVILGGLAGTVGSINIVVNSATSAVVYHNDVIVFSGTLSANISIPITICTTNHIYITFTTTGFTSVSILGNFASDSKNNFIMPLHDNIVYVTDKKYYIHSANVVTTGNYDFCQIGINIADICAFTCMSNSGVVQDIYACFDTDAIKIYDIDGSNLLCNIAINFVPTSIAVCAADSADTYYLFAVHGSIAHVYQITNFSVAATYSIALGGVTRVASICGGASAICCTMSGATHIAMPSVSGGDLVLEYRQVDSSTSAQVFYHNGQYFVLRKICGGVSCKVLNANYQISYSATCPNVSLAYEYGGKVYGLTRNYLQVLYEG